MSDWLLTASPAYLMQAMNEMRTVDPDLKAERPLDLGIVPFYSALSEYELYRLLGENPPIFIRHLHPVQARVEITGDAAAAIEQAAADLLAGVPDGEPLGIQIRRVEGTQFSFSIPDLRERLAAAAKPSVPLVMKDPVWVLSVFLTPQLAYLGVSTAEQNLSAWPGGAMRLKMEPYYPSRSRLKIEEAFYVFQLFHLDLVDALDLGAAPGGWTSFLLDQGFQVTAVDTGELDDRLLKKSNLHFIKENALQVRLPADSFDFLTSDMSWSPHMTCRRIVDLAPVLREDGRVLVTIKLVNKKVTKTIGETLDILKQRYEVLGCKQLFHNRDEVTAYLRKK